LNNFFFKVSRCFRYPSIPYYYTRWLLSRWFPRLTDVHCYSSHSVLQNWYNFSQYYSFRHSIPDFEKKLLKRLSTGALSGSVVIDIGANIGLFTLCLADIYKQSKIYSFEPSRDTFQILSSHINSSPFSDRVSHYSLAVSSFDGITTFLDDQSSSATNRLLSPQESLASNGKKQIYEVPTVSLDSFCSMHNIESIELLKVDVEGFEAQVLDGASMMLDQNRIKCIFLELCPSNLAAVGTSPLELWSMIDSLGLNAFRISPDSSLHPIDLVYFEQSKLENILLTKQRSI